MVVKKNNDMHDLKTQVALLIQKVDSLEQSVNNITRDQESRIRKLDEDYKLTQIAIVSIRERMTVLNLIQVALTTLAAIAVYIFK